MTKQKSNSRSLAIQKSIHAFIADRLKNKVEKLSTDDPKIIEQQAKHDPEYWLASAVKRAIQIQVVTHPLKATCPHAHITKTTSLYCPPSTLPKHSLVSTHDLGESFTADVTGNAAALDVYALLQLEHEGETLLDLCLAGDDDLKTALNDDPRIAEEWISALAEVTQSKMQGKSSHAFAKQVFWLAGDDMRKDSDYVILAPLYSSSLVQRVFEQVESDLFSDEAKEVKSAAKLNIKHEGVARSYPNLAVQMIGGSNPQGISLLNSKRQGKNYLLASLPPVWGKPKSKLPLGFHSIFSLFEKKHQTKNLIHALSKFLTGNPPANHKTRTKVDRLVECLLDELFIFADLYQKLPAGWSTNEQCYLSMPQQCWLDPGRALQDSKFADNWLNTDWYTLVESDFANWLNNQLANHKLTLGEVELRRWARDIRNDSQWQRYVYEGLKAIQKDYKSGAKQ